VGRQLGLIPKASNVFLNLLLCYLMDIHSWLGDFCEERWLDIFSPTFGVNLLCKKESNFTFLPNFPGYFKGPAFFF
jgi:hypothetical protein